MPHALRFEVLSLIHVATGEDEKIDGARRTGEELWPGTEPLQDGRADAPNLCSLHYRAHFGVAGF